MLDDIYLENMAKSDLIPDLMILANEEKLVENVVLFLYNLVKKNEDVKMQMLENKFYGFVLDFLFHQSEFVREAMLGILFEISYSVKSDFLMQVALIQKLFEMIKTDTLQIKMLAFTVLI